MRLTSAAATLDTNLAVLKRAGGGMSFARDQVNAFLLAADIKIVNIIGEAEAGVAIDAYDRFGKGRHPARLNVGDCFAYACARTHNVPLLFKGEDFALTAVAKA